MNLTTRTIVIVGLGAYLGSLAGCQLPTSSTTGDLTAAPSPQVSETTITYTTASDRLNVATAGSATTQLAGFGPAPTNSLPNMTQSTLRIHHPHPSGRADLAQAVLTAHMEADSEDNIANLLTSFTGDETEAQAGGRQVGTWVLDIPAWQVEAVQQRLRKNKFFRRARVLGAETELSVEVDGNWFGKPYRAVPELDALLLRVAREGRPLHLANARPQGTSLQRVPPVR